MRSLTTSALRIFLASGASLKTEYRRSYRTRKALCGLPRMKAYIDLMVIRLPSSNTIPMIRSIPCNPILYIPCTKIGRGAFGQAPLSAWFRSTNEREKPPCINRILRLIGIIKDILEDQQGILWLGTAAEVLSVLIQTPSNLACVLLPTGNSRVWVTCNKMIPVVYGHSVLMVSTSFTQRRKSLFFFR